MTSLVPEVLWAQRADVIYLTVNLTDIKDQTIQLGGNKIEFKGKGDAEQKDYHFDLEFYDTIDVEKSKQNLTARNLIFVIQKSKDSWWPSLQKKGTKKPHWLKTDFARWKDEDEEDEEEGGRDGADFNNMDFSSILQNSGMGGGGMGLGGLGGLGGDDAEGSSDDDEDAMPDLEEPNTTK